MTAHRWDRAIRRPLIVAIALGAGALAALGSGSASAVPSGTIAAPGPAGSGWLDPLGAVTAAAILLGGSPVTTEPAAIVLAAPIAVPTAPAAAPPRITTTARPGTAAAVAITFALAQRGLPYVWGGDGPEAGEVGFDCSGLTTAAYVDAGVRLPRTAHTQYYAGPHVPPDASLEPGDLVFYGVPERVHHVGLYLGEGRMVNAPHYGKPVRLAYVRYPGDDYLGATRPAAGRDAPGLLDSPDLPFPVPQVPAPDAPPGPTEFPAPPAPDDAAPAGAVLADGEASGETPSAAEPSAPAGAEPTTVPPSIVGDAAPGPDFGPATPVLITLPDGAQAELTSTPPDHDAPPVEPAEPGQAALTWHLGENGSWTATVRLHPEVDAAGLAEGATIVLTAMDGTRIELTVRSRESVDPATAAETITATGDGLRLVLLAADAGTGGVLVVIAD